MISKTTEAITTTDEKALQQILARIDNAKWGIVTSSVEAGAALCDAHKILGRWFDGWIEDNCTFGRSTAYRYYLRESTSRCDRTLSQLLVESHFRIA